MSGPLRIVVSGCSGGGKSTLLAEMARRGWAVVEEPGRRVVDAERAAGGRALPWVDIAAFAHRCAELAIADFDAAGPGVTFFDRSLIDAVAGLERETGAAPPALLEALETRRYAPTVVLAPPWPALFHTDDARRHGFEEAMFEYRHLLTRCPQAGYAVAHLPRGPVADRADWLEAQAAAMLAAAA